MHNNGFQSGIFIPVDGIFWSVLFAHYFPESSQLRFQSSSWYPSLSFYFYLFTKALFYFCLRVCIWLCESLGLGVVSAEARWGCWRPCCWSYRHLWAIQHGWGNWTSQIHQSILNHVGNAPAPFRYFFPLMTEWVPLGYRDCLQEEHG